MKIILTIDTVSPYGNPWHIAGIRDGDDLYWVVRRFPLARYAGSSEIYQQSHTSMVRTLERALEIVAED